MRTKWSRFFSANRIHPDGGQELQDVHALRSDASRDWDRIIFSPSLRRMHDKTQVFPLAPDDMTHSRLTHSLEVGSVGRSLGNGVGSLLERRGALPDGWTHRDVGDIVAAACLAHDIGNPPFGHSGEDAIGSFFRRFLDQDTVRMLDLTAAQRHDLEHFEGNAQGFRILTRRESAGTGLRLTATTLATFLKYPRFNDERAPLLKELDPTPPVYRKKFGVFCSEAEILRSVAAQTGMIADPDGAGSGYIRHPLAWLVEAADDICYRVIDLEDGVHLRLIPLDTARGCLTDLIHVIDPTSRSRSDDRLDALRGSAIHALVVRVGEIFEVHADAIASGQVTRGLLDHDEFCNTHLGRLKELVETNCYCARDVLEIELAGYELLGRLVGRLVCAALKVRSASHTQLQDLWILNQKESQTRIPGKAEAEKLLRLCGLDSVVAKAETHYHALLQITDHVSDMTDSSAVKLYRHLFGTSLPNQD